MSTQKSKRKQRAKRRQRRRRNGERNRIARQIYSGHAQYRLGDVIGGAGRPPLRWHLRKYPHSIASQYIRATGAPRRKRGASWGDVNYAVLARIVNRAKGSAPPRDALVCHLRLGDVLEGCAVDRRNHGKLPKNGRVLARKGAFFHKNSPYIRSGRAILHKARAKGLKKVVLVGGSHNVKFSPVSAEYVLGLRRILRAAGIRVATRLGGRPDADFAYLARAKHFLHGTGGFSRVAYCLGAYLRGEPMPRPPNTAPGA